MPFHNLEEVPIQFLGKKVLWYMERGVVLSSKGR